MLIIRKVYDITPRGRLYTTQFSIDTNDIRKGETTDEALDRQLLDNAMQLNYERSQLL